MKLHTLKFAPIRFSLLCFTLSALTAPLEASLSISSVDTSYEINFNAINGSGFAPDPSAGQLDSDTWRVTGLSDGDGVFGGSYTTGDLARGIDNNGASTGGVYAFEVDAGNYALGAQPTDSDFSPGTITLRIQNLTGASLYSWNLSYDLYVLNDQDRSSDWIWEWSVDDSSYTSISSYTSTELRDVSPVLTKVQSPSVIQLDATVAANGYFYLRWTGDDAGGSGSRDEFAIDNISVLAIPEPGAVMLGSLGLLAMLLRHRRAHS